MFGLAASFSGTHATIEPHRLRFFGVYAERDRNGEWHGGYMKDVDLDYINRDEEPLYDIFTAMRDLFGPNGDGQDAVEIWVSPAGALNLLVEDELQATAGTTVQESDKFISLTAVQYADRVFTLHIVNGWADDTPPTTNPQAVR